MSDGSSLRPPIRSGMISQDLDQKGKFPFSAFTLGDPDKDASPVLTLNSPWSLDASISQTLRVKTLSGEDYTVTLSDLYSLYVFSMDDSDWTISLPAVGTAVGKEITITTNVSGTPPATYGVLTVQPDGSETIGGSSALQFAAPWLSVTIIATAEGWSLKDNIATGIVESGSNSNGSWVKWADGTMMQRGSFVGTTAGPVTHSWPQSFVGGYGDINPTATVIPFGTYEWLDIYPSTASPTTAFLVRGSVGHASNQVLWSAWGKWDTSAGVNNRVIGTDIVDSGSNSNGSWIKWADGRLEMETTTSSLITTSSHSGSSNAGSATFTYPQPRLTGAAVWVGVEAAAGTGRVWPGQVYSGSTTGMSAHLQGNSTSATGYLKLHIVTKWK
jgi:hypothetical protein